MVNSFLSFILAYQEDWLENNIYQEMSLTASVFAYTWSKWNADCGKDKIIIQAVEQLEDEQPLEVKRLFKIKGFLKTTFEYNQVHKVSNENRSQMGKNHQKALMP